jgi:hypothetical protein
VRGVLREDATGALERMNGPRYHECPYPVGHYVSTARYDRSERPANKIGWPALVILVEPVRCCESGFMVTVRGTSGREVRLDTNWLAPVT